jgi:hypothetical protein
MWWMYISLILSLYPLYVCWLKVSAYSYIIQLIFPSIFSQSLHYFHYFLSILLHNYHQFNSIQIQFQIEIKTWFHPSSAKFIAFCSSFPLTLISSFTLHLLNYQLTNFLFLIFVLITTYHHHHLYLSSFFLLFYISYIPKFNFISSSFIVVVCCRRRCFNFTDDITIDNII